MSNHGSPSPPLTGTLGRADLLRALLEQGEEALAILAGRLGYVPIDRSQPAEIGTIPGPSAAPSPAVGPTPAPTAFLPVPFWRPVAVERAEPLSEPELPEDELTAADSRPPDIPEPAPLPIVPWPRLRRRLDEALRTTHRRRDVDTDALVRLWSRGEVVRKIPRRRDLAHARVALILDDSPRLALFWGDQLTLAATLIGRLAPDMLRILPPAHEWRGQPVGPLGEDEVVLALTDLGAYGGEAERAAWERYGRALHNRGAALVALTLCPAHRWPSRAAALWSAIDWSAPGAARRPGPDDEARAAAVARLLATMAPALRVEPGLLRELRHSLGPSADLGTEAEAWNHSQVRSGSSVAAAIDPEHAPAWQRRFAALDGEVKAAAARAILRWHSGLPREIRAVEVAQLQAGGVPADVLGSEEVENAQEWFRRAARTLEVTSPERSALGSGLDGFAQRTTRRAGEGVWSLPGYRAALARVVRTLQGRHEDAPVPVGVTPEMLAGDPALRERRFTIWHAADGLQVLPPGEPGAGSQVAAIAAREPRLAVIGGDRPAAEVDLDAIERQAPWPAGHGPVTLVTDLETVTLAPWRRPDWAVAAGRDRYGLWAELEVTGVTQRMRWLAPGRFWMGSPDDEKGRWDDEGPRHPVELTSGFWLADTPCTQELYKAVMGSKPSQFPGARRPVERVSWDDCQTFCERLSERVPGLDPRLPTEAEWEYACRAGTETARWMFEVPLEKLAFYSDNSDDKSHDVGLKLGNPWGLYGMLGNVYEWCQDWWQGSYEAGLAVDPTGPDSGSARVIRSGSRGAVDRLGRAASRYWFPPGNRGDGLGFRLARGQGRGAPGSGRWPGRRTVRDEPSRPGDRPDGARRGGAS